MSYQHYCMVQNVGGLPKETAKDCQPFPHFLPEKDMQDILAPEDHKQGVISKDRPARHHHGKNAKKMEVAWACYQERPR